MKLQGWKWVPLRPCISVKHLCISIVLGFTSLDLQPQSSLFLVLLTIWKHFMGLWYWPAMIHCSLMFFTCDDCVVADVAWFGEWGPFKFLPCYAAQSGPWAEALDVKWVKPGRGSHREFWFISTHAVLEQTCKSSEMSAARFVSKLRKRSRILSGEEIKVSFRQICEIK